MFQGYCVLINCSPGKVLSAGNCTSAPSEISGLGYQMRLWFVPASDNATVGSFVTETPASGLVLKKFYSKVSMNILKSGNIHKRQRIGTDLQGHTSRYE